MKKDLSRKEFEILETLISVNKTLSQRDLEKNMKYSLATVNRTMKGLDSKGYVKDGLITDKGIHKMDSYSVKRAIFLAAGFGSRLVPITLNTPKPLITVHGKRIIDGLIDAVIEAGIEEIIIVRGYLAEKFDELKEKYPQIQFVNNNLYNEANNISSALCVKDYMKNAYVFEADLLISNPSIIKKYHYTSDFLAIKKKRTDDWCFEVEDNIITEEKIGGTDCYQMVGISYWDKEDGEKLSKHILDTFNMPGGKECYWEQVPLVKFKDDYKVEISECLEEDIVEIDTFNELKKIDKTYDV